MSSLRDEILSWRPARAVEPVEAFGRTVYVRVLTGAERDQFEQSKYQVTLHVGKKKAGEARPNLRNIRARFAVLVLADEKGGRLFEDEDAEALGAAPGLAPELDRVWEAGMRLNGMADGAVEDAEGNSATTPSSCSGTS